MKGPSHLLAVIAAVGSSLFALFCFVGITFAGNRARRRPAPPLAALVFAATFLAWRAVRFISRDEHDSARSGLMNYAMLAATLLVIGLQTSSRADGKVLAFGLVMEACAFSAFALMPD